MQDIINLVSTVGFPIVCCGCCFWYVKYITDQHNSRIDEVQDDHRAESTMMVAAINNNTVALTRLVERMEMQHDRTA